MHRIDTATAVAVLPGANPAGPNPNGYWINGNPGTGTPATVADQDFFNWLQEEPLAVLVAAGVAPVKGTLNQLLKSLNRLFGGNVTTIAATGAVTVDMVGLVLVNAAGGNVILTLPAANALPNATYRFVRTDASGNSVTVQRAGGDAVDAGTSFSLSTQGAAREIASDGVATWRSLSQLLLQTQWPPGYLCNLSGVQTGNTTLTIKADVAVVASALGGSSSSLSAINLNWDGSTVGIGGMDTGAMPASSDLFIYLFYNPNAAISGANPCLVGTTAGGGSTIYSGAHAPAGYSQSVLVSSLKVPGSGHLNYFWQIGRRIFVENIGLVGSFGLTAYTAISISTVVPANAKSISGNCVISTGSSLANMSIAGDVNVTGVQFTGTGTTAGQGTGSFVDVPLITPQTFYAAISTSADTGNIQMSAYTF